MRLFELNSPTFFFLSPTEQATDTVVRLGMSSDPLGEEIEAVLEAERPQGALSRRCSLYLVTQPGGAEFTYLAQPEGPVERQHTGWLKALLAADPLQNGVRRHYAIGYWTGKECAEQRGEPWQHRAEAVKLVRRIGRSSHDVDDPLRRQCSLALLRPTRSTYGS